MINTETQHTPTLTDLKGAPLAWLQANPGGANMADLFELNDDDFAVKCIRALMEGKPFDMPLQVQHLEAGELFSHFYFESRNLSISLPPCFYGKFNWSHMLPIPIVGSFSAMKIILFCPIIHCFT
jgi:hypothetical protein